MPASLRKLIGAILLVILVMAYPLLAITAAAAILPGSSGLGQLVFYMVAGLVWVPPAGLIIWWMSDRTARTVAR